MTIISRNTSNRLSSEKPFISVIMPAFNAARFIGECIESVLRQTWPNLELIIIDDGSTDQTASVISEFGESVRYFYKENSRQAATRNFGILRSAGDYLAFIDADDIWLPDKLEKQLRVLQSNPKLGLVSCSITEVDVNGQTIGERRTNLRGNILADILLGEGSAGICGSTPLVPRAVVDSVGLFDPALPPCEDTDLFWRIAAHYPVDFVDEPLVLYRLHKDNSHRNLETMNRAWKKLYAKAMSDPIVRKLGWRFRLRCRGRLNYVLAGDYALASRWKEAAAYAFGAILWWPPNALRIGSQVFKRFCERSTLESAI